jgi:flagellar protein FliT
MIATMCRMPSQIELYEEMSLLSCRMVEAARARDWNCLLDLERDIASLRKTLISVPEDRNQPITDLTRKRHLIQCILDDDAEVRRHTEPWMEHLRQFLDDGEYRRAVLKLGPAGTPESAADGLGA